MERRETLRRTVVAAAAAFAAAMVIFPGVTEEGAKSAMLIWANSIVPVLLPFFIFSDFIRRTGELKGLPPRVYPFVMAFLSGYPMGAKAAADCVRSGRLTPDEGKSVMSFSMVTGPAFILFTVGEFLGSGKAAWIVAIAHYAGAFLNGLFHRQAGRPVAGRHASGRLAAGRASSGSAAGLPKAGSSRGSYVGNVKSCGYAESFTDAIFDGFHAMAAILAYLIFFTIGIALMEKAGVFGTVKSELAASVIKGFMEMTVGVNSVGLCDASLGLKTAAAAALVSFGGLSVAGQSVTVTRGSGITPGEIFFMKLTHGMLSAIIAVILALLVL